MADKLTRSHEEVTIERFQQDILLAADYLDVLFIAPFRRRVIPNENLGCDPQGHGNAP
jgi:hypothetical protein